MRKKSFYVLVSAACVAACVLLGSCATEKPFSTEGLTAEEIFQRAQDAADRGNNAMAIAYYTAVPEKFPDDKAHGIWSTYEIAFLYHRMGKNDIALTMFNQILDRYAKEGDSLPPAPQILAQKLKAELEARVVTAAPKKP
jgi:outer membrane protein assembly factor BamD (BamD/ComL family)